MRTRIHFLLVQISILPRILYHISLAITIANSDEAIQLLNIFFSGLKNKKEISKEKVIKYCFF